MLNTLKCTMPLKVFGIQDQLYCDEMLLMLDYGIFYEFIEPKDLASRIIRAS